MLIMVRDKKKRVRDEKEWGAERAKRVDALLKYYSDNYSSASLKLWDDYPNPLTELFSDIMHFTEREEIDIHSFVVLAEFYYRNAHKWAETE